MEIPKASSKRRQENQFIAEKLHEVGDLLEQQAATQFRIIAYREVADFLATLSQPIRDVYMKYGKRGLEVLPTIGSSIASAIAEILDIGTLVIIDRLRGSADSEKLFQTVLMIGPSLAQQIHDTLHIETLEALEAAVVDSRLATVKGIGLRRSDSIGHALNDMLARRRPARQLQTIEAPPISEILAVDEIYHGTVDCLPAIKPRRFNETGARRIVRGHEIACAEFYKLQNGE